MWKKALVRLGKLEPNNKWNQWSGVPPSNEQLDYLLAPTVNPGTTAVLAQLDTLAEKALDKFFRGGVDLARFRQILQHLGRSAFAALGSEATKWIWIGIEEQLERWEETAISRARTWIIRSQDNRALNDTRAKDYERLAWHLMDACGTKVEHPFQAADALLDSLCEHLHRIKSPYLRDWAMRPLCVATAQYCLDLRTCALKQGNTLQADVFGDMAQRFVILAGPSATTDPRADLYAYRRTDSQAPYFLRTRGMTKPCPPNRGRAWRATLRSNRRQ